MITPLATANDLRDVAERDPAYFEERPSEYNARDKRVRALAQHLDMINADERLRSAILMLTLSTAGKPIRLSVKNMEHIVKALSPLITSTGKGGENNAG